MFSETLKNPIFLYITVNKFNNMSNIVWIQVLRYTLILKFASTTIIEWKPTIFHAEELYMADNEVCQLSQD